MKRFHFRLQSVIEIRDKKEKECQRELAQSLVELNRQENRLEKTSVATRHSRENLRQALARRTEVRKITALDDWRIQQEREYYQQFNATEQQRSEVDQRRKALVHASKEKKILERLRERSWEEHQAELRRQEQSFLDELGCRIGRSRTLRNQECSAAEEESR